MKILALYKPDADNNGPPSPEKIERMGKFIDEMTKAGKLITTDGRKANALEVKIRMRKGKLSVTDGPFTEAKEIIGGFALMQVDSREELIELTRRFLEIAGDGESEIIEMFGGRLRQLLRQPHTLASLGSVWPLALNEEGGLIGRRDGARVRHQARDRGGVPHRVAAPDRRARAHRARRRPGRGAGAGGAGRGARAMAGVGRARQPRRLADGDRQEPRHRRASPRQAAGTQARGAGPRHGRRA